MLYINGFQFLFLKPKIIKVTWSLWSLGANTLSLFLNLEPEFIWTLSLNFYLSNLNVSYIIPNAFIIWRWYLTFWYTNREVKYLQGLKYGLQKFFHFKIVSKAYVSKWEYFLQRHIMKQTMLIYEFIFDCSN